jgi:hypothetical protein
MGNSRILEACSWAVGAAGGSKASKHCATLILLAKSSVDLLRGNCYRSPETTD